jgi:Short C-terminal domain/Phospholipase_D-nuclease N-terminal
MVFADSYPFLEIVGTMLVFFAWMIWIWAVIVVLGDVFSRHDLTGWGKAGWTLAIIVLPFLGMLVYVGIHGQEMAKRRAEQTRRQEAAFQDYVRQATASDGGSTGEIERAKRLLDSGAITQAEFENIKRKALA